jgi:hypothetical protein
VAATCAVSEVTTTVAEEGISGAGGKELDSAKACPSAEVRLLPTVFMIAVGKDPEAGTIAGLASCGAEEGSDICSVLAGGLIHCLEQVVSGDLGLLQEASSVDGDSTVASEACGEAGRSEEQPSCAQRMSCKASRA